MVAVPSGTTVGSLGSGGSIRTPFRNVPTTFIDHIDLADDIQGYSDWYKVPPGKALVSIDIQLTDGQTWDSAIVDMQWALIPTDRDHGFAVTYNPPVQFTSTKRSLTGISAFARGNVRVKTTTAESGGDPAAKVILGFF